MLLPVNETGLHEYVNAPNALAVKVALVPEHIFVELADAVTEGIDITVMSIVLEDTQLPLDAVTVYCVFIIGETVYEPKLVTLPGVKVKLPDDPKTVAFIVVVAPAQIVAEGLVKFTVGVGVTLKLNVAELVQPIALAPINV
jgi:hypothetical protein